MPDLALPMLLEDGSRLDWPDATYAPEVRLGNRVATVIHRLSNAPTLERLIEEGAAEWATELRCPKTLLSRIDTATELRWEDSEVDGLVYLIPGLVATKDTQLEAQDLNELWSGLTLDIPAGWWLARGREYRTSTLRQALLSFAEDNSLPNGGMRVSPDLSSGEVRFVAHLASDIYPTGRHDRSMQIAGLIGACAHFPEVFTPEIEDEHTLVREIRGRLDDVKIPAWDADDYDPAQAATAIEAFVPQEEPFPEQEDE